MQSSSAELEAYTLGHSNHDVERFAELLRRHRIETVVDVRSAPYSRYSPHFNRESLNAELKHRGIGYVFAGERLGGRPKDPGCYKTGEVPSGNADYLAVVDYAAVARRPWYQAGISRLLDIARASRVALMCSEEDPLRCHRHKLIAQTLLDQGVTVRHIRGDGTLEPAQREAAQEPREHVEQLSLLSS